MTSMIGRRLVLGGGALGVMLIPVALRSPESPGRPGLDEPIRIHPPEGARLIHDPTQVPKRFSEAPQLAEAVAAGRLPTVAERLGQDPLVLRPLEGIGRYGGVMRRAFIGPNDVLNPARFASGPDSLLAWDPEWRRLQPNIGRDFEMSADGRSLVVQLRRGMRWSDGHPLTAEDFLFWRRFMHDDSRVVPRPSSSLMIAGRAVRMEARDAYTIEFISPEPYRSLGEVLAGFTDLGGPSLMGRSGFGGFAPAHYLGSFHPAYRDEAALTRDAREAGFSNWAIYLKNRNDWALNTELPVVTPWKTSRPINTQSFELERNPYSIWVDEVGNQLPYIDRINHVLCAGPDAVVFKAATGNLDIQDRHLSVGRLPFLLKNRARSNYNVHLDPFEGADVVVRVNLDYGGDPTVRRLLADRDFRRALSLAVDRVAINETLLLGTGRPTATVPAPRNRFYPGDAWASRWAVQDLARANRMLDRLGLAPRDNQGFRLRPDDKRRLRLECMAFAAHFDYPAVGEMLKEQWRAVGIDLDLQIVDGNLFLQRVAAGEAQLGIQLASIEDPIVQPDFLLPTTTANSGGFLGLGYVRWFQTEGREGKRPPPVIEEMMRLWRASRSAAEPERVRIGQDLIRRHVDEVLSIGVISGGPSFYGVRLASRRLGNVPRGLINAQSLRAPANSSPMTFFFKDRPSNRRQS